MASRSLPLLLALTASCTDAGAPKGADKATPATATTAVKAEVEAPTTAVEPDPPPVEVPAIVPVELHEWGLIGAAVDDPLGLVSIAAGPQRPRKDHDLGLGGGGEGILDVGGGGGGGEGVGLGKPVIYAHIRGDAPQALKVSIAVPSAEIYEHWPSASVANADGLGRVSWDIAVKPRSECAFVPWPAAGGEGCERTPDNYCELSELAAYRADDGACIVVGDAAYPLLFYRAGTQTAKLAVTARRDEKGFVKVTPVADAGAPESIVHVRRTKTSRLVTRYALTPDGVSLPPRGTALGGEVIEDPIAWMNEALAAGGLTPDEAAAFMRAWQTALLAPFSAKEDPRKGTRAPTGLAPSRDAILYVMTPAELERLAPITVEPTPTAIKRVFVGHIDLLPPAKP